MPNLFLETELQPQGHAETMRARALHQLIEAQEDERRRVSRELHDEMGQSLAALKLALRLHREAEPLSENARRTVAELEQVVDRLMLDVHRLAWQLRPPALDDFGLVLALQRYTEEWAKLSGIPVEFQCGTPAVPRLPSQLETILYRAVQEALTNVFKHSQAKRVSVRLQRNPESVSLSITDDGQGFRPLERLAPPSPTGKLGLLGMRERVMFIGGSLDINSAVGAGTTVAIRVPFSSSHSLPLNSPEPFSP